MIDFISGKIVDKTPASVVVDLGGIGYEVIIPLSTFDVLPPDGHTFKLYTHDHVREDAHILFGFATKPEREFFRMLQNVSGIGPKTALGAISGMSIRELRTCIAERDSKRLSKLQGIGKKTAERIVIELSDKINPLEAFTADAQESPLSGMCRDAILALTALGHSQDAALKAVRILSQSPTPPKTTEEFIKLVLSPK